MGRVVCIRLPPINLIMKTLLKVRNEEVEDVILVVPFWSRKLWFPLLLQLTVDLPVQFRPRINLLSQRLAGAGELYHQDLATLHLTAWKLSGAPGVRPASQPLLQLLQGEPSGLQPGQLTIANGHISVSGAMTGTSTPLVSL